MSSFVSTRFPDRGRLSCTELLSPTAFAQIEVMGEIAWAEQWALIALPQDTVPALLPSLLLSTRKERDSHLPERIFLFNRVATVLKDVTGLLREFGSNFHFRGATDHSVSQSSAPTA